MRLLKPVVMIIPFLVFSGCSTVSIQEEHSQGSTGLTNADVIYVKFIENIGGSWTVHVTVSHPDTGWDDYANGWDVVLPDGEVIKPDDSTQFTRTLLHPHVEEQPFTRSQSGIRIPPGITKVRVRAHDIIDGFGGEEILVDLETASGNGYEVERQ